MGCLLPYSYLLLLALVYTKPSNGLQTCSAGTPNLPLHLHVDAIGRSDERHVRGVLTGNFECAGDVRRAGGQGDYQEGHEGGPPRGVDVTNGGQAGLHGRVDVTNGGQEGLHGRVDVTI
eukprot:3605-Prorocentrum_minimum.AAC.1